MLTILSYADFGAGMTVTMRGSFFPEREIVLNIPSLQTRIANLEAAGRDASVEKEALTVMLHREIQS